MPQQIPAVHAQRVKCSDHAALRIDLMDRKDSDDVGEQSQYDHTRDQAHILVDPDICRGPADPHVIASRNEHLQIVNIRLHLFAQLLRVLIPLHERAAEEIKDHLRVTDSLLYISLEVRIFRLLPVERKGFNGLANVIVRE